MVKLSVEMITKLGPGFNKRRPDETVEHYLSRLTHIYLQEKNIDGIDSIPICKNLSAVYLYDNKIEKLENLEFAPNLTHLYLHNNRIKRMENLNHLKKLTKLHLSGNSIKVVEGLENLTELVELSIESQHLPPGEKLIVDPRCLMTLMNSLRILNISNNHMESLGELGSLAHLEHLDASHNNLADMKEMSVMLKCWPSLVELNLSGNPLCAKHKYRERIIVAAAASLRTLDSKEVLDANRQFLHNWKLSKEMTMMATTNHRPANEIDLGSGRHVTQRLNGMKTYVMPEGYQVKIPLEYKKEQTKLRSAQMGSGPNETVVYNSPGYKQINLGPFMRDGLTTSSAKSNLKSDFESAISLNGLNGLTLNSVNIIKNRDVTDEKRSKKSADLFFN